MYNSYRIKKPKGGFRSITEPKTELRPFLSILKEELDTFPLSPRVHGFVPGRSTITNALPHRGKRYVLNVDIKDFFPSVKKERLMPALESYANRGLIDSYILPWVEELCFWKGCLPQGAATSPVLSNIYASPLDDDCTLMAHDKGWEFTRYADDITFSGDDSLKERKDNIVAALEVMCGKYGLRLNPKKTKLMPYYQCQKVTGIVVNNDKLTLARPFKEAVFQQVKGKSIKDFSPNFLGLLEYIRSVDPVFYGKLQRNIR